MQKLNLKMLKLKKTAQVVAWTCLDRRTKKGPGIIYLKIFQEFSTPRNLLFANKVQTRIRQEKV